MSPTPNRLAEPRRIAGLRRTGRRSAEKRRLGGGEGSQMRTALHPFSLLNRENAGKLPILSDQGAISVSVIARSPPIVDHFPCEKEQGICNSITGNCTFQ